MAKKSEKVKLSPPWDAHMQMLKSFFKGDDRIVVSDGTFKTAEKHVVWAEIGIRDADTMIAFDQVLRKEIEFGNVTLRIKVCAENDDVLAKTQKKLKAGKKLLPLAALKEVLKKNPAFSKLKMSRLGDRTICFCIFKPVALQWYNDNLGSPWKIATCTYERQSDNVFADEIGALFCTEPLK